MFENGERYELIVADESGDADRESYYAEGLGEDQELGLAKVRKVGGGGWIITKRRTYR